MKLLICTQTLDTKHPILGFFHRWVQEFATYYDEVHVVCLNEGTHSLPANVFVHTLGKEKGGGRILYLLRFYRHVFLLRNKYDHVFVHMNPEYVVLAGLFWRVWRKRIMQWYSHRSITLWLRISAMLSHLIFSTTPHAMRLQSSKVQFVGHGIDLDAFVLARPHLLHFVSYTLDGFRP